MARISSSSISLLCALACVTLPRAAAAQSTIKTPGNRTPYRVELEPHLLLQPFESRQGAGAGFRASIEILPRGFIRTINNSVAIGVGLDWLHFPSAAVRGSCSHSVPGPNGTTICTEIDYGSNDPNHVYLPVVMQWNFWLHPKWSVFGEPGILPHFYGSQFGVSPFSFYAGGRFHFTHRSTLTLRIGYPTLSLGVSFLL